MPQLRSKLPTQLHFSSRQFDLQHKRARTHKYMHTERERERETYTDQRSASGSAVRATPIVLRAARSDVATSNKNELCSCPYFCTDPNRPRRSGPADHRRQLLRHRRRVRGPVPSHSRRRQVLFLQLSNRLYASRQRLSAAALYDPSEPATWTMAARGGVAHLTLSRRCQLTLSRRCRLTTSRRCKLTLSRRCQVTLSRRCQVTLSRRCQLMTSRPSRSMLSRRSRSTPSRRSRSTLLQLLGSGCGAPSWSLGLLWRGGDSESLLGPAVVASGGVLLHRPVPSWSSPSFKHRHEGLLECTDTRVTDPPVTDTRVTDTRVTDTRVTDTRVTDPPVTDTRVTDTRVTDTRVTDTRVTDTRVTLPLWRQGRHGRLAGRPDRHLLQKVRGGVHRAGAAV